MADFDHLKEKKSFALPKWAWGIIAFLILVGGGTLLANFLGAY